VVGVEVSVDDVKDHQAVFFRYVEVRLRIIDRVAHGAGSLSASAEYVRGSDHRIAMQQLT
jgi:hypothetical protein